VLTDTYLDFRNCRATQQRLLGVFTTGAYGLSAVTIISCVYTCVVRMASQASFVLLEFSLHVLLVQQEDEVSKVSFQLLQLRIRHERSYLGDV